VLSLQGLSLIDLPGTVVNPFNPPPPGSDDPHQGVDFGDLRAGDRIALTGRRVMAVLPGRVAAVMADRFPYGNAILLETPLDELPENWLGELGLPTPGPAFTPVPALTCPKGFSIAGSDSQRSLYLLYAHMLEPPQLELGEAVGCGQEIGAIGSSGNALNPHLHLEARLGPASVQFGSLAHYDPSATQDEMANYCAWRVSGSFQAFDPLRLLRTGP
jgi:murein DD-endopeptidase MepM/ murein hydrolase activator NlpD